MNKVHKKWEQDLATFAESIVKNTDATSAYVGDMPCGEDSELDAIYVTVNDHNVVFIPHCNINEMGDDAGMYGSYNYYYVDMYHADVIDFVKSAIKREQSQPVFKMPLLENGEIDWSY